MFKPLTDLQLDVIAQACERDAETSLHTSVIKRYADQKKVHGYFVKSHLIGFIIEEVIEPEAELIQLFIFSEYRGSGFGAQALNAWVSSLVDRKLTKVFLEVREGNEPAIRLYQNLGFKTVGRRKNYYQLNLGIFDALLMDKSLTSQ